MQQSWRLIGTGILAGIVMTGCLASSEHESKPVITKEAAVEIAEKAFVDAAAGQILKFKTSDSVIKSDDEKWHFFVKGIDEFARPGYHATVSVDKKTGKASVSMGE